MALRVRVFCSIVRLHDIAFLRHSSGDDCQAFGLARAPRRLPRVRRLDARRRVRSLIAVLRALSLRVRARVRLASASLGTVRVRTPLFFPSSSRSLASAIAKGLTDSSPCVASLGSAFSSRMPIFLPFSLTSQSAYTIRTRSTSPFAFLTISIFKRRAEHVRLDHFVDGWRQGFDERCRHHRALRRRRRLVSGTGACSLALVPGAVLSPPSSPPRHVFAPVTPGRVAHPCSKPALRAAGLPLVAGQVTSPFPLCGRFRHRRAALRRPTKCADSVRQSCAPGPLLLSYPEQLCEHRQC